MRLLIVFISILFLNSYNLEAQSNFQNLADKFLKGYEELNIQSFGLDFKENFKAIKNKEELLNEKNFFQKYEGKLNLIDIPNSSSQHFIDYGIMKFEIDKNLERINLSLKYHENKTGDLSEIEKIYDLPNGKEWYKYYLKFWLGSNVSVKELVELGEREIKEAESEIEKIRNEVAKTEESFKNYLNDSTFFLNDETSIQKLFEERKNLFWKNLHNQFNNVDKIGDLKIEKGTSERMASAPGYYFPSTQTFYYNLFDEPYNIRQIDWLLIHEGIPGHHFQSEWINNLHLTGISNYFTYFGFLEGWAAYTEEIGKEIGAYKTHFDYLGKWEWDLIRSVRVVLDVGLNYYGWNDEKAMNYWKEHIKDNDEIGVREINRMKRWPAQIHTYKYGGNKILDLKNELQNKLGDNFDVKIFHDAVLNCGTIPFTFFEAIVTQKMM